MDIGLELLIADALELYKPIAGLVINGSQLLLQFQATIELCAQGTAGCERQLLEKINELATAKMLVEDPAIQSDISYEPDLLPSGRKIDFVIEREADNLYVEVKTVRPEARDDAESWGRYEEVRNYHPENVNFIVREDWMGGMIYANSFASRSKFLQSSLQFEERLEEVQSVRVGPGVLVFCGTGFQWDVSELEDFADFYRHGRHRADDPFALMEQHEIAKKEISIRRNISDFAFIQRDSREAEGRRVVYPVRGPKIFR
jgi:hypothetical protein